VYETKQFQTSLVTLLTMYRRSIRSLLDWQVCSAERLLQPAVSGLSDDCLDDNQHGARLHRLLSRHFPRGQSMSSHHLVRCNSVFFGISLFTLLKKDLFLSSSLLSFRRFSFRPLFSFPFPSIYFQFSFSSFPSSLFFPLRLLLFRVASSPTVVRCF